MSTRHPHDDFGGISRDLPRLLGRRRFLALPGGAGAVAVAGCAGPGRPPGGGRAGGGEQVAAGTIPSETAGPYPGDGSNGPPSTRGTATATATTRSTPTAWRT